MTVREFDKLYANVESQEDAVRLMSMLDEAILSCREIEEKKTLEIVSLRKDRATIMDEREHYELILSKLRVATGSEQSFWLKSRPTVE